MRKSEMDKSQTELFHSTINYLSKRNWHYDGDMSWFEDDQWEEPEIGMIYKNKNMELLIEYSIEKDLLTLILTNIESGKEIMFDIFPENNLSKCLDFLTNNQDNFNSRNFQSYIRQLLDICPKIFTYKGDNAYRLKPE